MEYASFWRRAFAAFIDSLLLSVVVVILTTLTSLLLKNVPAGGELDAVLSLLPLLVPPLLYYTIAEGHYGTTLGKRLMNCRIVTLTAPNGNGIGAVRAFSRFVMATVFQVLLLNQVWALMNVDSLWLLMDRRRRTLHDKVFGTIVVHDPSGTFAPFDPESLKRYDRQRFWFILLLAVAVASVIVRFLFTRVLVAP